MSTSRLTHRLHCCDRSMSCWRLRRLQQLPATESATSVRHAAPMQTTVDEVYTRPFEIRPWLIDRVLPRYEFRGQTERIVFASPEAVFQALRSVTLAEMPLATFLGNVRYVPGRILGRKLRTDNHRPFLEAADMKVLVEEPNREVIFVTVGRRHDIADQKFVPIPDLATFERFSDPDYQKL